MPLWPVLLLLAAVIVVNGWTDAPNAISTAVASGALPFPAAAALAAGCNVLGTVTSIRISDAVARTLFEVADFGCLALPALTAALAAAGIWAVWAWRSGIPTSESHALSAGLIGAALGMGVRTLHLWPLLRILGGVALILPLSALLGRMFAAILPTGSPRLYTQGQILGAALTAYLHGAQDGQKFMGLLALVFALRAQIFTLPPLAAPACAGLMALGTLLGGRRIIDTVARRMVRLDLRRGFAADLAAAVALGVCTVAGLPVSTTHAKAAAILGAGASPDGRVAGQLGLTWLLTFPGCALIAWILFRGFVLSFR